MKKHLPAIIVACLVAVLLVGSCAYKAAETEVKRPKIQRILKVVKFVWWVL